MRSCRVVATLQEPNLQEPTRLAHKLARLQNCWDRRISARMYGSNLVGA